jgi:transposase
VGCPFCGVVAHGHGRQTVELIDAPCFAVPVRLWWRKRRWRCPEPSCPLTSFMEQDPDVTPAWGLLTLGHHEPEVVVDAHLGDCRAEGFESRVETVRLVEKIDILRRPGVMHAREDCASALERPGAVRPIEHAGQETVEDKASKQRMA